MDDKRAGFSKDELKRRISEIAEASKKSSYSDQRAVEKAHDLGREMVDEYPRNK